MWRSYLISLFHEAVCLLSAQLLLVAGCYDYLGTQLCQPGDCRGHSESSVNVTAMCADNNHPTGLYVLTQCYPLRLFGVCVISTPLSQHDLTYSMPSLIRYPTSAFGICAYQHFDQYVNL